jgi:hypothetical protein
MALCRIEKNEEKKKERKTITVILVEWPMITDFGVALVLERERERERGGRKGKDRK